MKTKMYIIGICALMITTVVWAAEGFTGPESPQKHATAGLNATDVDQFMSLTEWSNVSFNKIFTYAGFEQQNYSGVDLGAAFKAGPVYIGAWYKGTFGEVSSTDDRKISTERTKSGAWFDGTKRDYTTSIDKTRAADHTAAVLIGFSSIGGGVRLGYARSGKNKSGTYYESSVQSDERKTDSKKPNIVNDTVYDPKGYVNQALRTPAIDFGMKLTAGSLSITPTVGFALDIAQNSSYGKKTVTSEDKTTQTHSKTVNITGGNETVMTLKGALGADIGLNDPLNSTFSFGYDVDVDIYGKKKHIAADGTTKELGNGYIIKMDEQSDIKTVGDRTITDTFNVEKYEKSNIKNKITLGYSMQKDFTDRLSFFAGVEAPISFNFTATKTSPYKVVVTKYTNRLNNLDDYVQTTTETGSTKTVKEATVIIDPAFKAALSYAVIPSRLFLSFGTEVKPFGKPASDPNKTTGYQYTTSKTSYDGYVNTTTVSKKYLNDPARIVSDTVTRTSNPQTETAMQKVAYNQALVNVKLGVRWNIVDAVSLDAAYTQSVLQPIKWTEIGNLKLACTIKF